MSSIRAQENRAEVLRRASLILWDEAPMAPKQAVQAVDDLLRDLMGNDLPFGGKVIVLGGDFRQVLPVMPHCSRDDIVAHSVKSLEYWRRGDVRVHSLAENKRAEGSTEWQDFLLDMGDGRLPTYRSIGEHAVKLPEEIVAPLDWDEVRLVKHVYPDMKSLVQRVMADDVCLEDLRGLCSQAVLTPKTRK